MNIAREWFSQIGIEQAEDSSEEILVDDMCFVMNFYNMSKQELDDLYVPEYIILRDYAVNKTKEQNKAMENMFNKTGIRGK